MNLRLNPNGKAFIIQIAQFHNDFWGRYTEIADPNGHSSYRDYQAQMSTQMCGASLASVTHSPEISFSGITLV